MQNVFQIKRLKEHKLPITLGAVVILGAVILAPSKNYTLPPKGSGAINPDITQANIDQTICSPHWSTRSIRPSSSYTTNLKRQQLKTYKDQTLFNYEEDHIVPLEIGGAPSDPMNLWPEPYNIPLGARQKDKVENYLHAEVCNGNLTLEDAQKQIETDWTKVYNQIK